MVARVLIAVVLVAGCQRKSALYCAKHPNDLSNCPLPDAAPEIACSSDPDCPAGQPHCLGMACVECLDSSECKLPDRPICDSQSHACVGCTQHSDCPTSQACLPNGVCGDDTDVVYVAQGGTDRGTCTHAAPCATVTFGLTLINATRPFLKISGTVTDTVMLAGMAVTVLADPGAKLVAVPTKVGLNIGAASEVRIYDLDIVGDGAQSAIVCASSTLQLDGVTVEKAGHIAIDFKGSGTLFIQRSRIIDNPGGGLRTDQNGTFNITNSFIAGNGTASSMIGGAQFLAPTASSNRFEFNTVADNQVKIGGMTLGGAGVFCAATNTLDASNNLVTHNLPSTTVAMPDTLGCNFGNSKVAADPTPFAFVNAAMFDYHLQAGSTAIDTAPGDPTVATDIDGDLRPQGAAADFGADEHKLP